MEPESLESQQRLAQVRDLLFGDTARELKDRVERLARDLETAERSFTAKTEALQASIEALNKSSVDRQTLADTLRGLAGAIEEKGTTRSKN